MQPWQSPDSATICNLEIDLQDYGFDFFVPSWSSGFPGGGVCMCLQVRSPAVPVKQHAGRRDSRPSRKPLRQGWDSAMFCNMENWFAGLRV